MIKIILDIAHKISRVVNTSREVSQLFSLKLVTRASLWGKAIIK